jgi:hypothetical protein
MVQWCFSLFEAESGKSFLRKMLPRIAKAAAKGIFYFVIFYVFPMLLVSQVSQLAPQLFADYGQTLFMFATVLIFFAVACELTSGTLYQHALNIGKAIILIVFFVLALNGGIIKLDLDLIETQRISILADVRIYLLMLIAIDLLGLAKSVLQAVNFLSEKTERQLPQPWPAENA